MLKTKIFFSTLFIAPLVFLSISCGKPSHSPDIIDTGDYQINNSTDFYTEWGIDPIQVDPSLVGTFNNYTALQLLASQENYSTRTACAFQRLASSGVNQLCLMSPVVPITNPTWSGNFVYSFNETSRLLNLDINVVGQATSTSSQTLNFTAEYKIVDYFISKVETITIFSSHNEFTMTPYSNDSFWKCSIGGDLYKPDEFYNDEFHTPAHSLDDIGTIINV